MSTKTNLSERYSLEKVIQSKVELENITYIKDLLSSLSSIICIINNKNQIVFSNDVILGKYGLNLEKDVLGFRPGEIFNCVNANNNSGGCGTTEKCQFCGAYRAIEQSKEERQKVTNECRIIKHEGDHTIQLDLEITANPFTHEEEYTIISMQDITEKKRKELLERIFFHDIINIAGSLNGILQLYKHLSNEEKDEYLQIASSLSTQIIYEIKGQQHMLKAESGNLIINPDTFNIDPFLQKIADQMRFNHVAFDKKIKIIEKTNNAKIITDETLLTRVLTNMTKNAIEATKEGEEVTIKAVKENGQIRFEVHNDAHIPYEVQQQLFQRSYSTKGKNRGVGTYSMKLIGERYLKGKVGFTSSEKEGTTFYINLPLKIE